MPINIPRNKPPVASSVTSGNRQASSGNFSGKSVSISQQKDAKEFIQSSDVGQSIQQRKPIPTPRSKHKVAQANRNTGFLESLASKSASSSHGSQSQAETSSAYDDVWYEPQTETSSTYDRLKHGQQSGTDTTYNRLKHSSQTADSLPTQGPYESLPRSSGSQSQAETSSAYDDVWYEPQTETSSTYDRLKHGQQSGTDTTYNRLKHSSQTADSLPTQGQYESLPRSSGSQSQAETSSAYDDVRYEPQAETHSTYNRLKHKQQSGTDTTYNRLRHSSQTADSLTTQGQYESLPRSSGSQSQAETSSAYDDVRYEPQTETFSTYNRLKHGQQSETDTTYNRPRHSSQTADSLTTQGQYESLPRSSGSQSQAETSSAYDDVRYEPQTETFSTYNRLKHGQQSETDTTYNRPRHSSQTADSLTTQGQYESLPRSLGSQSQAETSSAYDDVRYEPQTESDLTYDYVWHGDQAVGGTVSHSQDEELYAEVTADQLRGVRISKASTVGVGEIASHAIDEASRLVDDATRYIGELEKDIISIMEHDRLQKFSSGNIRNLGERVTNQHNLCLDSFAAKLAAQGKQLEELAQSKKLTGALSNKIHQNIGVIRAMRNKFSVMRNQLAAESKKIDANFFDKLDIEKPAQPRVLTELSSVRKKIGELRQSADRVRKVMEQLKVGIKNMGKVNFSAEDIGKAVRPITDDYKTTLNKLLVELSHCNQSLSNTQKSFKNFIRSMPVTESTYTKALHSQQTDLALACRQDIDRVLGEIGEIESLYPQ